MSGCGHGALLAMLFGTAVTCSGQTTAPETEYQVPTANSSPGAITLGPDGALWFTETRALKIGRITSGGTVSEFPIALVGNASSIVGPADITAGADGNIWFCYSVLNGSPPELVSTIVQMTPSGQVLNSYQPSRTSELGGIAAGADGAIWFTEAQAGRIGRVTTGGQMQEYPVPTVGSKPSGIALGSDGALWFTDPGSNDVGRISTAGTFSTYPIPSAFGGNLPTSIVSGPDGAMWFTAPPARGATGSAFIGRITTSGVFSSFQIPGGNSDPETITNGPDGRLWFTDSLNNQVDSLSIDYSFTPYVVPSSASQPFGIAAGPDGALWFTEQNGNRVGRLGVFSIATTSLPAGATGAGYSTTLATQSGTTGNRWSISAGMLPDGLSLDATTGQISGSPMTGGSSTFTVQVSHSGLSQAVTASRVFTIAVTGLPSFSEIPAGSSPGPITLGPDGELWFTEGGSQPRIARVTAGGELTSYPLSQLTGAVTFGGITLGPDGALWFTCWQASGSYVGKMSTDGVVSLYPTATYSSLQAITMGPDDALWFTEQSANRIGRITTGGSLEEYPLTSNSSGPYGIAAGEDGALWFTESSSAQLGRITTVGVIREYPINTQSVTVSRISLGSIVSGPDGALWFLITNSIVSNPSLIGRMTTAGVFSYFAAPQNSLPAAITNAPDGSLWFTDTNRNQVDSITTGGVITEHTVPTGGSVPGFLAAGPSSDLWFTEQQGDNAARLVINTTFREYPTLSMNSNPGPIALGPDNAMWFAEQKLNLQIARVSSAGMVSEYAVPRNAGGLVGGNQIGGISAGPDGNVWYTVSNPAGNSFISSVTPNGVVMNAYQSIIPSTLGGITTGPDGALWFAASSANLIGRITPAGSATDFQLPTPGSNPYGITLGPDQALWFTEWAANKIGRMTPSGAVNECPLPAGMQGPMTIVAGSGNNLYFALSDGGVGQITTGGIVSSFSALSAASSFGVALGPDGNVWFTDPGNNQIHQLGRPAYTISTANSLPRFLALGPDGALWFTESSASKVGRLGIPVIVSGNSPGGTVGAAYSATATASGGTAPYKWSIVSGSLSAGLALDEATGVISGTPSTAGSFTFLLGVTDAGQPQPVSSSQSRTIVIGSVVNISIPPLKIASSSLASGITETPYNFTFAAQGGTSPYTWTATGLPSGLSLSASGSLSGAATQAGTYSLAISVSDSGSPAQTATQSFSLVVILPGAAADLSITTTSAPNGTVGVTYSTTLAAQGGAAPYFWTATGLPVGLKLSTTGVLSGATASAGNYTITVQVSDSSSPALTAAKDYVLTIGGASSSGGELSITGLPETGQPEQAISVGLQLGQAYSTDISGTATLSFTPSAAHLPSPFSNPGVCFAILSSCATTPQMTSEFTIPAGSTVLSLPQIETGTVAGTILLTVTSASLPGVTGSVSVPAIVPIIEANSVQITNVTNTGFVLELVADSTPRDLQSATFTFNAANGSQLVGPTSFTMDLSSLLAQWYSSSEGQNYGSLFSLSVPFSLTGSSSAIGSVSVTLTNTVGTSAAVAGSQ